MHYCTFMFVMSISDVALWSLGGIPFLLRTFQLRKVLNIITGYYHASATKQVVLT